MGAMARSRTIRWAEVALAVVVVVGVVANLASAALLPPRMSTKQAEIRVKEGQTGVVLECSLDVGDDPIQYRWLKNHRWVTASLGYGYRGYRQVLLALHEIEKEHAGTYTCSASNEAGAHSTSIKVIVEGSSPMRPQMNDLPHTDEILSDIAASLSDVLAEGECNCDTFFLLHAASDTPAETHAAQANLINTIGSTIISDTMRVGLAIYSDHVTQKLSLGRGTNQCALRNAFKDLSHPRYPTRLEPVLRETFKKFKKSKTPCKVLFLPVFGNAGKEGADVIAAHQLKKLGVKIFILEVTTDAVEGLNEMASQRGDGRPYHWRVPLSIWRTIVIYMKYMTEEIEGCMMEVKDYPGQCVGSGQPCDNDDVCRGAGQGCFGGVCKPLQCNVNTNTAGCCASPGDYWCGDVTRHCTGMSNICDGRVQCMNGADEDRCWSNPCPEDKVARCQSSTLCLGLMDLCDGEAACPGGEDEDPRFCRSFPCPIDRPFRCRSGKCIEKQSVCDGIFKDCEEGEDEALDYCDSVHTCPPSKPFKCDYGICIEERMQCDGHFNCLDAKDELLCSKKSCPASRPFKCLDGVCISMDKVCNGVIDGCRDGDDENNCTFIPCPVERSFKCNNGRCIDEWLVCNRNDDCGDATDELQCTHSPSVTTTTEAPEPACYENEFLCHSGACIPIHKVCDGRRNCPNGEDEQGCQSRPCPSDHFRCTDSTCVPSDAACNGFSDCADGSDEINCTITEEDEDYGEEFDDTYNEYDYGKEDDQHQWKYTTVQPVLQEPIDTHVEYDDGTQVESTVPEDESPYNIDPIPEIEREDDDDVETNVETSLEYDDTDPETMLTNPEPPQDMRPPAASSGDKGSSGAPVKASLSVLTLVPLVVISLQQIVKEVVW